MTQDVEKYVKSCLVCQQTKVSPQKPAGELRPLPVPTARWTSVTMDLISDLPECAGYDSIMVVVDRFTKMAHFVPCKDLTSEQTARLYIDQIVQHHSIPEHIISDWEPQFKSKFWKEFWATWGVKTVLSSAYHLETDGQTERTNGLINQYICCFCTYLQDNWVELLAMCEFAYNNSISSATGFTSFMAHTGMNPKMDPIGKSQAVSDQADVLADELQNIKVVIHENLRQAQDDMKRFADANRQPAVDLKPGDKVFLSTKNFRTNRPKQKWNPLRVGPYKVISPAHPGSNAYKIELPKSPSCLHPVFHVSLLTPAVENTFPNCIEPPPAPMILNDEEEYDVECIVDQEIDKKTGEIYYKVCWTGYRSEDDTLLHEDECGNLQGHIEDWHKAFPKGQPKRCRKAKK
jgi:hypothetical protein